MAILKNREIIMAFVFDFFDLDTIEMTYYVLYVYIYLFKRRLLNRLLSSIFIII